MKPGADGRVKQQVTTGQFRRERWNYSDWASKIKLQFSLSQILACLSDVLALYDVIVLLRPVVATPSQASQTQRPC